MEDRKQEYRCRRAAGAITWGAVLSACLTAWDLVLHDFRFFAGWWLPLLLLALRRNVREGKHLGGLSFLLGYVSAAIAGTLWSLRDGRIPVDVRSPRWLAGLWGALFLLWLVATLFTWIAWRHQVRAAFPERTRAQIVRHRQLARLVLVAGLVAVVGLVAAGITVWQETGSRSDALKCVALAALTLIATHLVVRRTEQGRGVAMTTGLLLPGLVVAPAGAVVGLIVLPFGSQSWVLAATWLVVSSMAIVISIRALLGGERKGQGDAG